MGNETDTLMVAMVPPMAHVRVQGRGTFKISPALKQFATSAQRQGCRTLVIDLAACLGMDSTFMGVLAGIAMRMRKAAAGPGDVVIINLDAKNAGLLETLGLSNVVQLVRAPLDEQQRRRWALPPVDQAMDRLDTGAADRATTARTMLAAHEDLVAVSADNQARFQDVLTYLKADLRRDETAGDGNG